MVRCFKPLQCAAQLWWAPVLSFAEWTALACEPCSPLRLFVEHGHVMPDEWPAVFALQTALAPIPLLTLAAQCGFWHMRGAIIDKLCNDEFGIRRMPGSPGAARLVQAVVAVLGCTDERAADILE